MQCATNSLVLYCSLLLLSLHQFYQYIILYVPYSSPSFSMVFVLRISTSVYQFLPFFCFCGCPLCVSAFLCLSVSLHVCLPACVTSSPFLCFLPLPVYLCIHFCNYVSLCVSVSQLSILFFHITYTYL